MDKSVRIPNQKRSIEKKEKIIEVAYRIFMDRGYFNTNTAEIAKEAGLSTGSVYSYFKDKKDILLACLIKFGNELTIEMCNEISKITISGDIINISKKVLQIFVDFHRGHKVYHYDVMSLQYRDEDIYNYFRNVEKTMMSAVSSQLKKSGLTFKHEREQTFLLFSMIRSIEDELVFNLNSDIDKKVVIDECAQIIASMITPIVMLCEDGKVYK